MLRLARVRDLTLPRVWLHGGFVPLRGVTTERPSPRDFVMETSMEIARLVLVAAFTVAAAVSDLRTHRLPNVLTVTGFVCGLLYHTSHGGMASGWSGLVGSWNDTGLLFSIAGFGVGFGILLVLWLIGGGGGGDVKYMGALGAWLGAVTTFQVFLVGTLFVALATMGVSVLRTSRSGLSGMRRTFLSRKQAKRGASASDGRDSRRRLIPFAVPIALATWLVEAFHIFYRSSGTPGLW